MSEWLPRYVPRAHSRIRLFCLPYAGGSAVMFRDWPEAFGGAVEVIAVELPGRGSRFADTLLRDVRALATGAAEALFPHLDRPFAVFGHSFGALVSFELARELGRAGIEPACLFASASRAPYLPTRRYLSALPDEALVDYLRKLNGTPAEILQDHHLLEFLLPIVRADLAADEAYAVPPKAALDCPIVALGGRDDPVVRSQEIAAWAEATRAEFDLRMFPGDHFFVRASWPLVAAVIEQRLRCICDA